MTCRVSINLSEILEALLEYLLSNKGHIAKVKGRTLARIILKHKKMHEDEYTVLCLTRRINQILNSLFQEHADLLYDKDVLFVEKAKQRIIKLLAENL